MFRSIAIILALGFATSTAQAALLSRAGGQAYYDTDLNITWLGNANLAATNTFGVSGIGDSPFDPGTMTWDTAQVWIAAMNTANYLGVNNWRLPTVAPINGSAFNYNSTYNGSTDIGSNISAPGSAFPGATGSEMAYLFYNTLGNTGYVDTSGNPTGCSGGPSFCLTNAGSFSNLQGNSLLGNGYWSGTEYAPVTWRAWTFGFNQGGQGHDGKSGTNLYAWAVSPGDLLAVPIPAAFLFPSALGLLGWVRLKSAV